MSPVYLTQMHAGPSTPLRMTAVGGVRADVVTGCLMLWLKGLEGMGGIWLCRGPSTTLPAVASLRMTMIEGRMPAKFSARRCLEPFASRCSRGIRSKTQIPFGNDKQRGLHLRENGPSGCGCGRGDDGGRGRRRLRVQVGSCSRGWFRSRWFRTGWWCG